MATTFGIWSGLTVGTGPILLGMLLVVFYSVFRSSGWAVILAMISFGVFMWLYFGEVHPEFIWVWLGNFGLLILKHRQELSSMPAFRSGVFRIFRRL